MTIGKAVALGAFLSLVLLGWWALWQGATTWQVALWWLLLGTAAGFDPSDWRRVR